MACRKATVRLDRRTLGMPPQGQAALTLLEALLFSYSAHLNEQLFQPVLVIGSRHLGRLLVAVADINFSSGRRD